MSPPASPYKSRIFNAINRTFLTWNDRTKISFNKLKILAKWGIQIVLYPIYLGIQSARIIVRQLLTSSADQDLSSPPALSSEIKPPVEQILAGITPQISQPLQGIATELKSKNLVLITPENNLLHLANHLQQQQLQNWIKWELANYYRQQRLLILKQKDHHYLAPIKTNNPHVIFPFNIFWQLMAWVEKSSIAITLNLFGEFYLIESQSNLIIPSNINDNKITTYDQNTKLNLDDSSIINQVDQELFHLENNQNIIKFLQVFAQLPQNIKQQILNLNWQSLTVDKDNPFTIQAIIRAAIDYFFGESQTYQKLRDDQVNNPYLSMNEYRDYLDFNYTLESPEYMNLKPQNQDYLKAINPSISIQNIEDPWLSATDIFANSLKQNSVPKMKEDQVIFHQLTGVEPIPKIVKPSPLERIKQLLHKEVKTKPNTTIVFTDLKQNLPQNNVNIEPSLTHDYNDVQENLVETSDLLILENYHLSHEQESDHNYIETPATNLGYEKHFLEYLLGWLDGMMALIEDWLIHIFKWLRKKI